MGTRGLMAFARNGEVKAFYNHFDSYPSGLGEEMVKWVLNRQGDFSEAIEQFEMLVAVSEDVPPTTDQKLALLRYLNLNVSTQTSDDWYSLLRETQGNPVEALKAGFYVDYFKFGFDSLFCEWAYVVDLDRQVLDVYKGFANTSDGKGLWGTQDKPYVAYDGTEYTGVQLLTSYAFADLTKESMQELEAKLDAEEEDE
jgi:hypothetical protein